MSYAFEGVRFCPISFVFRQKQVQYRIHILVDSNVTIRVLSLITLSLKDHNLSVKREWDKTRKRAVTIQVIRRLHDLDLSENPRLGIARDLFLFSFYTRGMSFIDIAFLRRQDLREGMLRYTRRKTGKDFCIRWEPAMQEIVDRYPPNPNGFLLPIITERGRDYHRQYKCAILRTNEALAKISASCTWTSS